MPALTSNASITAFEKVMANRAAERNAINVRGNPVKSRKSRKSRKTSRSGNSRSKTSRRNRH
jgi:hypothetical protein